MDILLCAHRQKRNKYKAKRENERVRATHKRTVTQENIHMGKFGVFVYNNVEKKTWEKKTIQCFYFSIHMWIYVCKMLQVTITTSLLFTQFVSFSLSGEIQWKNCFTLFTQQINFFIGSHLYPYYLERIFVDRTWTKLENPSFFLKESDFDGEANSLLTYIFIFACKFWFYEWKNQRIWRKDVGIFAQSSKWPHSKFKIIENIALNKLGWIRWISSSYKLQKEWLFN